MKFKNYFILLVILIILFSLGTVVARENNNVMNSSDSNLIIDSNEIGSIASNNNMNHLPIENLEDSSLTTRGNENCLNSNSKDSKIKLFNSNDYNNSKPYNEIDESNKNPEINDNKTETPKIEQINTNTKETNVIEQINTNTKETNVIEQINTNTKETNVIEQINTNTKETKKIQGIKNEHQLGSSNNMDLSITLDVKTSYTNNKYNHAGSEVPWTITVSSIDGNSHNTKVHEVLSENLQYISHNATLGTYNPITGIWDIGELKACENVSLTILTKLKRDGTYLNKVYARTDSNDRNLLNNFMIISIKTGSSKIISNITQTSDDRNRPQHSMHYASMVDYGFVSRNEIEYSDMNSDDEEDSKSNEVSKSNVGHDSQLVFQSPRSNFNLLSLKTVKYSFLSDTINDFFTSSNDLNHNFSNQNSKTYKGFAYDYRVIPVLIFLLFLIVLASIIAYEKIKS